MKEHSIKSVRLTPVSYTHLLLKEMYLLIKRLNKVDRMFILLWLDEKSYDEIAEITGTSRNNCLLYTSFLQIIQQILQMDTLLIRK